MILKRTDFLPRPKSHHHTSQELDSNNEKTVLENIMFDEFIRSDSSCMEIIGWNKEYKSARSCQNSLTQAILTRRIAMRVSVRGDRVFLVKRGVKNEA